MCELSAGSGSFCDPDRNRSQRSETLQALGGRTRLQPLLYPDRLSIFSSLRVLLASKDAPSSVLPVHTIFIHSFVCASNSAPSKKKEWTNRLESRILVIHVCVARSRIASGTRDCWSVSPCTPAAPLAVRTCAARRSDGASRGRRATLAGHRRYGCGSGTPFAAARPLRHGIVAVCAPVRARGHGAGRRTRCRCSAERATAPKARVLHARALNPLLHLVVASRDRTSFGALTAAPLQRGLFGDAPSRSANPWFPARTTKANGKRDPWLADSCETIWQS